MGSRKNSLNPVPGALLGFPLATKHTIWRCFACALVTLVPALVFISLLKSLGLQLADYAPYSSDEVGYYMQIRAFVHKGLSGGYFTLGEQPAAASFSHFGVHGPLFPILYGLAGKVVGWQLRSGPLFNVAFLTLALATLCLVTRPTFVQALLVAVFLLTYSPLQLTLISNLQDPVHLSAAILFAAGFAVLLQKRPLARTRGFRAGFWTLLVYTSLMRISWALMLLPYLLLQEPRAGRKHVARRILEAVVGVLLLLYTFRWICAPYPGDPSAFLMNKIAGLEAYSVRYVFDRAWHNFGCLLTATLSRLPFLPGILLVYESLLFGLVMTVLIALCWWDRHDRHGLGRCLPQAVFQSYGIWALTVAMIFTYYVDQHGAFRMFSAHLLLGILVLILSGTPRLYWIPIVMVAANSAFFTPCRQFIADANLGRFGHVHEVRDFARAVRGLIVYNNGADPWCNTILSDGLSPCFAGLPPGIGLSVCLEPIEFPAPAKSAYFLVDTTRQSKLKAQGARPLGRLSTGVRFYPYSSEMALFQNTRAPCEWAPVHAPSR
jgi:hypothetical protein